MSIRVPIAFQRWAYQTAGFCQLGLRRHDAIHETPIVKEALRRLPQDLKDERTFRIVRAAYLGVRRQILPKEEWVKFEEDELYLEPYLNEVIKECKEEEDYYAN